MYTGQSGVIRTNCLKDGSLPPEFEGPPRLLVSTISANMKSNEENVFK